MFPLKGLATILLCNAGLEFHRFQCEGCFVRVLSETGSPTGEWNRIALLVWPARVAIVLLVAWMCLSGYWKHPSRYDLDLSGWVNADAPRLEQIVRRLIFEWGTDLAGFAAIGVLAYWALGNLEMRIGRWARLGLIVGAGVAICGLVRGGQLGQIPALGHLVLPLGAYGLGAWVGRACVRGRRAILWLGPQFGALLGVVGVLVLVVGWLSLQDEPLAFEPTAVGMGANRKLANKLRGTRDGADWARRVRLSGEDLNQMVGLGLSRVSPGSKARLRIEGGLADAELSYALRVRGKPRYLNLHFRGSARIDDGELSVQANRLSIGRVGVPWVVLGLVAPPIASTIRHDRDLRNIVGSIASVRMTGDAVETVFKPGECNNTFLPSIALAISGKPNLIVPTREHVRHLVEGSEDLPDGEGRFAELLRRAFDFARKRSIDGDPILENRSALVALAVLLGHERVESVVGPVLDDRLREISRRNLQGVNLRGRGDWTKHFYVSAAMALIACEQTSDKIGVLKEVLDAEDGGSGFSFGDLAANRAGIQLARVSTYNLDSARALQERLAVDFPIDTVFPEVADLPEDLNRDEFQAKFGGVGGEAYRELVAEIDRRLAQCPALR
ncbi:hypothetical protein V5E97_20910 [Singulisphaera sp. Ch08]|uniref:Uncharacterized protein n=1 Tax=Singulisphaera sp. Ch08 TaxID=3120278 RepID=A0AAU7C624_9BACT